jgi:hypothetical protein
MKLGMQRLAIASVFAAWIIPRIIPLILFPGTYSYDSWVHMGAAEVIITHNRIPFSGEYYSNLYMPFLHVFAYLLYIFFGLPLIETFRLFATILVFVGFCAFFAFFRSLLGRGWSSIVAMFIFALDVDVIAQTNSVIPQHLAMIFLALALLAVTSLVKQERTRKEWGVVLLVITCSLPLIHHLTTYFSILFALALLVGSALSQNPSINRFGIPLSTALLVVPLTLLLVANPTANSQFFMYFPIVLPSFALLAITGSVLYITRNFIWKILGKLRKNWVGVIFVILGGLLGIGFFFATLLFYPYDRPLLWIALKFGLLSCLLGLGISVIRVMPWSVEKPSFFGLFIALSFLVVGVSFGFTGLMTLIDASLGRSTVWVFIGHRHFAFLLIPLAIMSTLALYKLVDRQRNMPNLQNRLILSTMTLLLLTFSIGGIYNLYQPIGGWYPEGMNQSEIGGGTWLREVTEPQSFVVTDTRLMIMMQGMFPADTDRFQFIPLQETYLSNPLLIREDSTTYGHSVYFLTSDLMEIYFLCDYPEQLHSLECSDPLDTANSTAKVYSRLGACVYWLAT